MRPLWACSMCLTTTTAHPIEERCGRHIQGIYEYSKNYSLLYADNPISFHAVPNYQELFLDSDGSDLGGARLGSYLN